MVRKFQPDHMPQSLIESHEDSPILDREPEQPGIGNLLVTENLLQEGTRNNNPVIRHGPELIPPELGQTRQRFRRMLNRNSVQIRVRHDSQKTCLTEGAGAPFTAVQRCQPLQRLLVVGVPLVADRNQYIHVKQIPTQSHPRGKP